MEKSWQDCIDYLEELSLLEDEWDSFGGEVSPYSLNLAKELVTKLGESGFKEAPFISPIPDGSIQLDWAFGLNCVEVLIPAYDDEKICVRVYNVEDPDIDFSSVTAQRAGSTGMGRCKPARILRISSLHRPPSESPCLQAWGGLLINARCALNNDALLSDNNACIFEEVERCR